jgi:hypothetical protein
MMVSQAIDPQINAFFPDTGIPHQAFTTNLRPSGWTVKLPSATARSHAAVAIVPPKA